GVRLQVSRQGQGKIPIDAACQVRYWLILYSIVLAHSGYFMFGCSAYRQNDLVQPLWDSMRCFPWQYALGLTTMCETNPSSIAQIIHERQTRPWDSLPNVL